jgi:transposase
MAIEGLRDDQWERIKDSLPGKAGDPGRSGKDNRRFIEGVMWLGRNGARWRALPEQYGKWYSVHKRFFRWSQQGVWQMIFNTLAANADTEWLMIDSTIVRAHQHAAGARRRCRTNCPATPATNRPAEAVKKGLRERIVRPFAWRIDDEDSCGMR